MTLCRATYPPMWRRRCRHCATAFDATTLTRICPSCVAAGHHHDFTGGNCQACLAVKCAQDTERVREKP